MNIAYFVMWFLVIFISFLLLLLFIPVKYACKGRWEEKISGTLSIAPGPLSVQIARGEKGEKTWEVRFLGVRLRGGELEKGLKGQGKKKPSRDKKKESISFSEFLSLLNRELIAKAWQTLKIIFGKYRPAVCQIKGTVGFSDPYHTGLFAAICPFLPGQGVRADFSREIPDLAFRVEGCVTLYILVFHGILLLLSAEGRQFMGKLYEIKKMKKNATRPHKAVYSTVK